MFSGFRNGSCASASHRCWVKGATGDCSLPAGEESGHGSDLWPCLGAHEAITTRCTSEYHNYSNRASEEIEKSRN